MVEKCNLHIHVHGIILILIYYSKPVTVRGRKVFIQPIFIVKPEASGVGKPGIPPGS